MNDPHVASGSSTGTATAEPRATMLAPVREASLVPTVPSQVTYNGPQPSEGLAGGLDFRRAWHAFRRRWVPALVLALVFGGLAGAATFILMPRSYEAVAWLKVDDKDSNSIEGRYRDASEYESFRKTQVQLIKSPLVLMAALRRPGIEALATLGSDEDKVGWLARNLIVSAPMESEVIQIRLRGEKAQEITQLVNAVTNAYLNDVVNKERMERLRRRDVLEKQYKENMAEVRAQLDTYHSLARQLGTTDSQQVTTHRLLLLDHLQTVRAQKTQLQSSIAILDAELKILEAKDRGEIKQNESVPEELVQAMIMQDPQLAAMRVQVSEIERSIAAQEARTTRGQNDPTVKHFKAMRDTLVAQMVEHREAIRPQIIAKLQLENHQLKSRHHESYTDGPAVLRMRRDMLATQLDETTKDFDKVSAEVALLGEANAELETRKQEITQLREVTDDMGVQLKKTELDIQNPNRVKLIEEATPPEGSDRLVRLMLSVMACGAGIMVGGGSVVAFEYLRDRLGCVSDLTQRIGMRVVGTTPRITRRTNPGQVAESVDGVRTVLMRTGREAPKVILVTSAGEHEGKTTFSSQLAASYARAGKRTLLLDGDLRHPNAHVAISLDLRTGLPELLRGEITIDEAVQPTGVEGLFAITGGACDYAAITALSKPETAAMIASLRDSFDHIVIDAGPVLAFADVLLLGQLSDVAILATMRDRSRVPLVVAAVDKLRSVDVSVLGAVVNGVDPPSVRRMYATPLPA